MGWSGFGRRFPGRGRQWRLCLLQRRFQGLRQRRGISLSVKVQVDDPGHFIDQVVVDRKDLEPSCLKLPDDRIDLRTEEHEVAHRDRVLSVSRLLEGRPAAEREGRLDRNARDPDVQVRPGPAVPMDVTRLIFAGIAEHLVDRFPAALRRGSRQSGGQGYRRIVGTVLPRLNVRL